MLVRKIMTTKPNQSLEAREGEHRKDAETRPANSDIATQKDNQIKQRQALMDGLSAHLGSRDLPKEQRFTLVDSTGVEHTDARHRPTEPSINNASIGSGLDVALNFLKNLPAVEQAIVTTLTNESHPISDKAPAMQHSGHHVEHSTRPEADIKVRDVQREHQERAAKHDVPTLAPTQFSTELKKYFDKIDGDHNGTITREELAKALQDPTFKGPAAQALASAYNSFFKLGGDMVNPNAGITISELNKFEADAKEVLAKPDYKVQSCAYGLGESMETSARLSISDINKHLQDPNLSGWEKTGYQYLKENFSKLHHKGDSLSKDDVMSIFNPEQSRVFYVQALIERTAGEQNAGHPDTHFANLEHPTLSIKPEDVNQGRSGDCRFDACIIAIAKTHPEVILQMITEKQGSPISYSVKFPGIDHAVEVSKPTEAEMGLYNLGSKDGYWPAILEKAYGQILLENPAISKIAKTPQEAVMAMSAESFSGANILQDIYGKKSELTNFEGWFGSDQSGECIKHMRAAIAAGEPVLIGTNVDSTALLTEPLHTGHEYAVVGVDNEGNLTLRNPWGGPEFTVKAKDVNKSNFHSIMTPTLPPRH
jgi:hypothetical protein